MKRVAVIAATSLVVLLLGAVAVVYFWWPMGMCANDVRQRVSSPDGELEAVIFIRNCGATTDYSTQVSVLKTGRSLPDDPGNVYITPHPTAVAVAWTDPMELVVRRSARGSTEEERVGEVRVRFQELPQSEIRGWTID